MMENACLFKRGKWRGNKRPEGVSAIMASVRAPASLIQCPLILTNKHTRHANSCSSWQLLYILKTIILRKNKQIIIVKNKFTADVSYQW